MRKTIISSALLLAVVAADDCQLIAGNYYCSEVDLVQYLGVGFSGTYNRVTAFNQDGTCASVPQQFSGPLSPLDEELTVHFRGPIELLQFGVYTRDGGWSKRSENAVGGSPLQHKHKRAPEPVVVTNIAEVTHVVWVDAVGNFLSSGIEELAMAAATPAADTSAADASVAPTSSSPAWFPDNPVIHNFNHEAESSVTGPSVVSSSPPPAATAPVGPGSGSWNQIAYYNADSAQAFGLTFMNNLGGAGSGVFDFKWGNSLSFAAADGVGSAAAPQVLARSVVPSNKEVVIFSNAPCAGDSCGFYRPGIPAYHGFGGNQKIFVFEFTMPTETAAAPGSFNYDMPAIWLLNAQIPRTLQYGDASCSCWKSGCGELDLFEVLNSGNQFLTNHLHNKQNGAGAGTASYFARPTSRSMKAAVVFDGSSISLVKLADSASFPASLDDATIQAWISAARGRSATVQL